MKPLWKSRAQSVALVVFERTFFAALTGFVHLFKRARIRQLWGDLAGENRIHPTATCLRPERITARDATIGSGCRLECQDGGHISLEQVHLEPQVSILAGAGTIAIGCGTYINVGSWLWTPAGELRIGRQVLIGPRCVLSAGNHGTLNLSQPIIEQPMTSLGISVGDGVWLGAGVVVCDGVTIGEGAVIGAGAVVTKDVPAYALAAGVPCRVLRQREQEGRSEPQL